MFLEAHHKAYAINTKKQKKFDSKSNIQFKPEVLSKHLLFYSKPEESMPAVFFLVTF